MEYSLVQQTGCNELEMEGISKTTLKQKKRRVRTNVSLHAIFIVIYMICTINTGRFLNHF